MHLKREVIRGHQRSSVAIIHHLECGAPVGRGAISIHQCPSVSISVHQCQSGANMHLHVQCDVSEDATILELEGPMKRAKLAHVDEREHTPS